VIAATADTYITLVAAQETARAAQAGVDRAEVLSRTIGALVNAQLRPGADASRAQAELAAARTQLIQALQAVEVARANLSQFMGFDPSQITVSAPKLLQLPPERTPAPLDTVTNPVSVEQKAVVEQLRAQLRMIERSYFPRFLLQGSAYARGTGAETNGTNLGELNGLAPTIQNYALGLSVTFPILDLPSIRAKEAGQFAAVRAESARYQQIAVDLKARWNTAVATLVGAKAVAANTPIQVAAARAATDQATARYRSGLGNIDEVAEAQRLLAQAEIDNALARLSVWRALLGVATAAGDLQPFVAEASQ
jgi:outer membrane protein TolC